MQCVQGMILEKFDMSLYNFLHTARQDAAKVTNLRQMCHSGSSIMPPLQPSMPVEDMLRALCDIAFGLIGMHGRDLLHCDLKSANVLVQV